MTDDPKLEIDWVKTFAGALAAVSTAVLLSTLGAVGTLIGAALGSVAVTVSSQLYAQGLARSRRSLAKAQETALLKVGIAQAEVRRAGRRQGDDEAVEAHLEMADERLGEAKADLDEPARPATWRTRLVLLPWKRIAALTAATFLVVLVAIAAFEAIAGRSVSSYTGGSDKDSRSTFTGGSADDDGGRDDGDGPDRQPSDATEPAEPSEDPTQEPTESGTPTEEPSDAPTVDPTASVDPTPTEPLPTEVDPTLPAPTPTP